MNDDEHRYEHDELTEQIIGCAFTVANTLGHGFLEKVYENALVHELQKNGLQCVQQYPVPVVYDGKTVGEFYADILVNKEVILELKAGSSLNDIHMAQCLNYLRATGLSTCLLFNFGKSKIEVKRIAL